MKNTEILEAAIRQAEKATDDFLFVDKENVDKIKNVYVLRGTVVIVGDEFEYHIDDGIESIIYSEDFAKAFFGEEEKGEWESNGNGTETLKGSSTGWQYHLQQMVISDDPIQYLEAFLK